MNKESTWVLIICALLLVGAGAVYYMGRPHGESCRDRAEYSYGADQPAMTQDAWITDQCGSS